MDCKQAEELMVAHARGELAGKQAKELEAHLSTCLRCRKQSEATARTLRILQGAETPEVCNMVEDVLIRAAEENASDIHLEPRSEHGDNGVVRIRVDGVLRELLTVEGSYGSLVARFQYMAGLDIGETKTPQTGRVHMRHKNRDIHGRFTFIPTQDGPRVTLRLHESSLAPTSLEQVGMSGEDLEAAHALLASPCGIVVFSGPIGSGKTTTMCAALQELIHPGISVVSIEDPIRIRMNGVNQIGIDENAGLGWREAMRAVRDSDPDIIMVGDLSDEATMLGAGELAISGHLVLTQVHSADAPGALTRLVEMGMPPYLLADSILGVTGQRLIRCVCENCKEEYAPPSDEIDWLREAGIEEIPETLWRGAGCEQCRETGYRGRTAIYEVMKATPEVVSAIADGNYSPTVGEAAVERSLEFNGAQRALEGVTTVHEVRRVTHPVDRG